MVFVAWVVWKDVAGPGNREGERTPTLTKSVSVTAEQLGKPDWRLDSVALSRDQRYFTATTKGANNLTLFTFRIDSITGQPVPRSEEDRQVSVAPLGTVLSDQDALKQAASVLTQLTPGAGVQRENRIYVEVPILFGGREVVRVRVDPETLSMLPAGTPVQRPQGSGGAEGNDERQASFVARNLVVPLGWVGAFIAVGAALYYSWKRAMFNPIRALTGEAKAKLIGVLRKTLWYHIAFGSLALAIVALHAVNFWGRMQLSVSWLALGMMATVVVSGAFGKFALRSDLVRTYWRRFHVPFTVLFFAVVVTHVVMKLGVSGGD